MTELGLKVRYPKKFKVTTDSDHNEAAISPNKLDRQFTLKAPASFFNEQASKKLAGIMIP